MPDNGERSYAAPADAVWLRDIPITPENEHSLGDGLRAGRFFSDGIRVWLSSSGRATGARLPNAR